MDRLPHSKSYRTIFARVANLALCVLTVPLSFARCVILAVIHIAIVVDRVITDITKAKQLSKSYLTVSKSCPLCFWGHLYCRNAVVSRTERSRRLTSSFCDLEYQSWQKRRRNVVSRPRIRSADNVTKVDPACKWPAV